MSNAALFIAVLSPSAALAIGALTAGYGPTALLSAVVGAGALAAGLAIGYAWGAITKP
ncbi:MAG TPA: hypothetical protein VII57_06045 [Dehalococcoidia bacterium]